MNTDKIYAESVANEYAKKETSNVTALRKLDAKAKLPGSIFAFTFGSLSAMVLGVGMCLAMGVIGGATTVMFVLGIMIGLVGIVGVVVNYPIYTKIMKANKEKYASTILELAKKIAEEK